MNYKLNRNISRAKAIDDFQDSIADPNVKATMDLSGPILAVAPCIIGVMFVALVVLHAFGKA
jgi:hypothetical protein